MSGSGLVWMNLSLLALAMAGRPSMAPATEAPFDSVVTRVICQTYIHGLDIDQVRAFGPRAIPVLERLLNDDRSKHWWGNAATALGALRTPESFRFLHEFVWARFRGSVDGETCSALEAAVANTGGAASAQVDFLVNYLYGGASPEFWLELPWRCGGRHPESLRSALSRFCIYSLGSLPGPKAEAALRQLQSKPQPSAQRSAIAAALRTHERLAAPSNSREPR